jgi:hypothetical protein
MGLEIWGIEIRKLLRFFIGLVDRGIERERVGVKFEIMWRVKQT